jgi:PAS domain S-box-containing protein
MRPAFVSKIVHMTDKVTANDITVTSLAEATTGLFSVDKKWNVTAWDEGAEKLLEIKSKDIIGKNLWSRFAGAIPLKFYKAYHKAFLQDTPIHFQEYWAEMETWFDVIAWQSDNKLSVSFKKSDPPDPESKDQQLKTVNNLYRFITEVTNDCLWEWDLQTKELFWIDGGHKRAFGFPIENAVIPQKFWENRLHPDDKHRVLATLNKIITQQEVMTWEAEYRFRKANNEYAHVHDRGHVIYDKDKNAVRIIGATQDISEKIALERKLEEERRGRQIEITSAVLTAQENERAEIGKELHDNLNQILAVAKMYLQMARRDDKNSKAYLEKTSGFIVDVIKEIRRISKHLIVPKTDIIELFDNIKNLLFDLHEINPIKIKFTEAGIQEDEIDEKLQLTIYRIIQEQVSNILKHSEATAASIKLGKKKKDIVLTIADNGKGDTNSNEKRGVGIINIKSRVALCNGTVTVATAPGKGYELKVLIPLLAE